MCIKKIFSHTILAGSLLLMASACKKLDLAPVDRFSDLTFWQSATNVNNSLNNIYSSIYTSDRYFYNEAMSDNAHTKLGVNTGADAIASGNFTISLPRFRNDWGYYYGGIKSCNIFLENVDKNKVLSDEIKERMKGEARFVRVWHHFNLMNWWGDVPLLIKDISIQESQVVSRTPRAEVLNFLLTVDSFACY